MSYRTSGFSRTVPARFAIVAAMLAAMTAAPWASTFKIDRTEVRLSARSQTALVNLTNGGKEAVRFEIKAFAWTQDAAGQAMLTPTSRRTPPTTRRLRRDPALSVRAVAESRALVGGGSALPRNSPSAS